MQVLRFTQDDSEVQVLRFTQDDSEVQVLRFTQDDSEAQVLRFTQDDKGSCFEASVGQARVKKQCSQSRSGGPNPLR